MGEELARQAPRRRRHGDAGSRIGRARRAGLRACVGHPLRRRLREEPLRRAHVHPAEPEAARHRACGSSSTRCATTSRASASSSSTTRSCAAPPPARSSRCCARRARPRCTSACRRRRTGGRASTASTPASAPTCSRPTWRSARSATTSVSTRSPTSISTASSRRPSRRASRSAPRASPASTRCPVPEYDTKLVLETDVAAQLHVDAVAQRGRPIAMSPPDDATLTYSDAGVDIAAGEKAVELIKAHVRSTFRPEVVGDVGGLRRAVRGRLEALPRSAARLVDRRRRHEVARRPAREPPRHDRHRLRRDVGRRHRRAGRASRCSSSTTSRSASSSPKRSTRSSRASPTAAARPGARCSAARCRSTPA